jgi:hypothetical protein
MFTPGIDTRAALLAHYGATDTEIAELLAYNHNDFHRETLATLSAVPLASEPHIADWERYQADIANLGVLAALRTRLVQLQFPIQRGISQTDPYRAATRKGWPTAAMPEATGLELQQPDNLALIIHPTLAGSIPVIIAGCRSDFVILVQALTRRNEPDVIPDSMGAVIVGGYNNWDRVQQHRQIWSAQQPHVVSEAEWQAEFQRLVPQKSRYQDRFILLSRGAYSAVPAADLGLTEAEWLARSLTLRLEHECCHYFTRRLFGTMRNNALDELIADYQGIISVNAGVYQADWFLRFMGLESFPTYRDGGRLQNYVGSLSAGAVKILQCLVKVAAENLERFNRSHLGELQTRQEQARLLTLLTFFTLEDLASDQGARLEEAWQTSGAFPPVERARDTEQYPSPWC